jgi:hypothetical protein
LVIDGGDRAVSDDGPPPTSIPRADPMGTVAGVVTTTDGRPVPGAAVQVTPRDDPAPAIPEMGVLTGDAGRYEWRLPPGRYQLMVRSGDHDSAPQSTTVTAGVLSALDFTLP